MSDISSSKPGRDGAPLLFAAFVIGICLFSHLGAIGLVGPDEPRYSWIARQMAASGDWVTPRLYGQPWFEKPVLYYWAAAIGFRLQLPAEWAARLPSAFAALAAGLAIGWLGWKHYGDEDGALRSPRLLAPVLFSTSVGAIAFARAAAPDMLFSAAFTLAMASAASVLRRGSALRRPPGSSDSNDSRDTWSLVFFGAWLGLAVLAKGPAGVILAGGAIGLWAVTTSQWRAAFRLAHAISIAAFCVVALPWYTLCALRNPDFIRVFILQHNFERYLTPVFQHRQPFWFFVPITLLALLPWTAFFVPTAQEGIRLWREKSWINSPGFYFACWAVFPLLFFSFSQSKLPGYILPSIPPLALLCSVSIPRAFSRSRSAAIMLASSLALTWCGLAVATLFGALRIASAMPTFGVHVNLLSPPILLVLLSALILIFAGVWRNLRLTLVICALNVGFSVELAGLWILPSLDPLLSARPISASIHALHQGQILTFRLPRAWNYGLAFYFERELPEWSPEDPGSAHLLTTAQEAIKLEMLGRIRGNYEKASKVVDVYVQPAPR